MPMAIKTKKADITVENSGSLKDLNKQISNKVIPLIFQKLGYFDNN